MNLKEKTQTYVITPEQLKKRIRWMTVTILVILAVFLIYGRHKGWFTSPRPLVDFFQHMGIAGYLLAAVLVCINTLFPIIPGSLPAVAMFTAYGNIFGFLSVLFFNLIGSVLSFLLSRRFGETFVKAFIPHAVYDKLIKRIEGKHNATKLAVLAYLVPGIPDDATTMILGLTQMSLRRFVIISLLLKPLPTFAYLFGISHILRWLVGFLVM